MSRFLDITDICTAGRASRPPLPCGSICLCQCLHLSQTHTSHSEKKGSQVPLSTPPHICSLPSRQTNQPNTASRRNADWYGPMKITTQPPAQSRAASKWHRTFSHKVLRVSREGFFCSLSCNSLTQGLSTLSGKPFFPNSQTTLPLLQLVGSCSFPLCTSEKCLSSLWLLAGI